VLYFYINLICSLDFFNFFLFVLKIGKFNITSIYQRRIYIFYVSRFIDQNNCIYVLVYYVFLFMTRLRLYIGFTIILYINIFKI